MAETIGAEDAKILIHGDHEIALLDVREHGQYGNGHPFFAVPMPYSRLELRAPVLLPRKTVPIILVDDGDGVGERAAKALADIGYTDIRVLDGGAPAWAAAGFELFEGVNVPSKTFGELVEHDLQTPSITAAELSAMADAGDDFILLDGRTPEEYQRFNIPGGISCPNAELPYRIDHMVAEPKTTVVINCAGRTRSIIGAQGLINFGLANRVVALENGTQGWCLAGFKLEHGADRFHPTELPAAAVEQARARATDVAERFAVPIITRQTLDGWREDAERSLYILDVRGRQEFLSGHVPGAGHAPGGQLVQATDQWVAVRGARIVVTDDTEVRAIVAAHWLRQMGHDAHVLQGVLQGVIASGPLEVGPETGVTIETSLPTVTVTELKVMIASGEATVLDLRPGMDFRAGHIPGAVWSLRPRIGDHTGTIVLVADEPEIAALAAAEIGEAALLDGGFQAWRSAGMEIEATPDSPSDGDCIDHLFFTSGRHDGIEAAMHAYLNWEIGLVDQIDSQERAAFHIVAPD